jgi:AraC-like DNA-binding protein
LKKRGTEDFASSVMVRVLVRGMTALGFSSPVLLRDSTQATIPLDLKSKVVKSAIEQGGLACLPLLGRGLHDLAMEPTHLALTTGRSAAAMLMRWQRLERYIHSKHRILIHELRDDFVLLEHVHKGHGPKPLAFEDLVVCGVLCALLEANGLKSVKAESESGYVALFPFTDPDKLSQCAQQEQTGKWVITWQGFGNAPNAMEQPVSWAKVSPKVWSPFLCAVGDKVAERLPELLLIDDAAADMHMSRRSFQRTLALDGVSYQQLQAEVRFRLAGWHLLKQEMPIAEIGFVCGYSDQAHLTREFNKRVGVPPAKYRSLFTQD